MSLTKITEEFTKKSIKDYELENKVFEINTMQEALFFQVKFLVNVNKYEDFQLLYTPKTEYSPYKIIDLKPEHVFLFGNNDTVLIEGSMDLNKTFLYHFRLKYHYLQKSTKDLVFVVNELQENQRNSLEVFLMKFFGTALAGPLLNELTVSRGISGLKNLVVEKIFFKIYLQGEKQGLGVINLQIAYVPDFAVSPEFLLSNCSADYLIFLQGDPLAFAWKFLIDCACKGFEDLARFYILRSEGKESLYLNATRQNLTLQQIEEKLFETGVDKLASFSSQTGFFSEIKHTLDLQKYASVVDTLKLEQGTIDDFSAEIFFSPQLTYSVHGTFYLPQLLLSGELAAIVTNIGGVMASVVRLQFFNVFPQKLLKDFVDINTFLGLETLSRVVSAQKLVLMTASRDVDLKNFLFVRDKSGLNESFWERGVHLGFEFMLSAECLDNKFCEYMRKEYDSTYLYSLYGELSQQESLVLLGHPPVISTGRRVEPRDFQPEHVRLSIPLRNANNETTKESSNAINFELTGDFTVAVENNKTLHFYDSKMDFYLTKIAITGQMQETWTSALNVATLNLSQLSAQAYLSLDTLEIRSLSVSALAVFGRDCFLQTSEKSLFQNSRCFFGDVDLSLDYQDYRNNYLEGYFPNATIWSLLFASLDFEAFRQYEGVSKHISNIKLANGVDLLYAMQDLNIKSLRFKNQTQSLEFQRIPHGFTVKGLANVLGLDGMLVLSVDPVEKALSGVFYLNSAVSFAGGNAIVMQTDLNNNNKSEEYVENLVNFALRGNQIPQEEQVFFTGKMSLFGVQTAINMSMSNEKYLLKTQGHIFSGVYEFLLDLKAPYSEKLIDAQFEVKGNFPENLIEDLEQGLKKKTIDWVNYVKNIINKLDKKLEEVKISLENKQKELCNEDLCPKAYHCVDEPSQRCLEYTEKTVCKKQENFCLKPEQKCEKEQQVCVNEKKTCVNFDASSKKCVEFKQECSDFLTVCTEWVHVCSAETVLACNEFEVETDENSCKKNVFACQVQEIKDVICENDCKLRRKQYEKYQKLFENLLAAKDLFNKKLTGFWIMNDEIQKKPNDFLNLMFGSFEEKLEDLVDPRNISMRLSIVSFKEDLKNQENLEFFEEKNFDFKDLDDFIYRIFVKLSQKWSERFEFDPILLKENEADLLNSLFTKLDDRNGESYLMTGMNIFI